MEKNDIDAKRNGSNGVIIGIMAFIIVLLAAALVYFNFINKADSCKCTGNNEVANNTSESDSLKPWMEYILKQDITEIKLTNYDCNDSKNDKSLIINATQLKDIFKGMMNYKLRLSYVGGGGWVCGRMMSIKYLKDGKTYEFEYNPTNVISLSSTKNGKETKVDEDFEKALNNSVDEIENESAKGQEEVYPYYMLIAKEIFGEYFK